MSPDDFDPSYVFQHHHATHEKLHRYDAIHAAAKILAEAILTHAPSSADQSAALRLVREAAMTACAAVALDGRLAK